MKQLIRSLRIYTLFFFLTAFLFSVNALADQVWKTQWTNPDGSKHKATLTFYTIAKGKNGKWLGQYSHGKGKLYGDLSNGGSVFNGFWVEKSGYKCPNKVHGSHYWGRAWFRVVPGNENKFSGWWGYCGVEPQNRWTGKRGRVK